MTNEMTSEICWSGGYQNFEFDGTRNIRVHPDQILEQADTMNIRISWLHTAISVPYLNLISHSHLQYFVPSPHLRLLPCSSPSPSSNTPLRHPEISSIFRLRSSRFPLSSQHFNSPLLILHLSPTCPRLGVDLIDLPIATICPLNPPTTGPTLSPATSPFPSQFP